MSWFSKKKLAPKFEVLAREKFSEIRLLPGDSLQLTYTDNHTGKVILVQEPITANSAMTINEGVLFYTVYEGRRALGGMALEKE